jgi:drug/metabolite transporter (DMT)-like permease
MNVRAILLGLVFVIIWSSAFTSARIIVLYSSPLAALSIRFLISGLIGVLIALFLGQNFKLTKSQWRATLIFGLCQNALYLGLNFVAMQSIEASLAAIIASTMPLMVAFAGWLFVSERLSSSGIVGLVLGFSGVTLIMWGRLNQGVDIFGLVLCVIGALALTVATLSLKDASSGGNIMMIVGLQMLIGSSVLALFCLFFENIHFSVNRSFVLAFAYTTVFPGLVATVVWFKLVNLIGAVKAATFHFLNPFFGVVIAWLFLSESISYMDGIGVVVITVGIYLVQISKRRIY